jgi:hypothetical protein
LPSARENDDYKARDELLRFVKSNGNAVNIRLESHLLNFRMIMDQARHALGAGVARLDVGSLFFVTQ